MALLGFIQKHPRLTVWAAFLIFMFTAPQPILIIGVTVLGFFMLYSAGREMESLPRGSRLAYLRAYGKSVSGQRAVIVLGSLLFFTFYRHILLNFGGLLPPNPFCREGDVDLLWAVLPPLIYGCTFILSAVCTCACLKLKQKGRKDSFYSTEQLATNLCMALFMGAFVISLLQVVSYSQGPIAWIGNWLLSSASDANLPGMENLFKARIAHFHGHQFMHFISPAQVFVGDLQNFTFFAGLFVFWEKACSLSVFLTKMVRRFAAEVSGSGLAESCIQTLREPGEQLFLKDGNAWLANLARSFWWIVACYIFLLWFFGMSEGPIGALTQNMIAANLSEAGFGDLAAADFPRLRLFLGAIYALYGTVPMAVMSCAFVPGRKARSLVLDSSGIFVSSGFSTGLSLCPYRTWSDFKLVALKKTRRKGGGAPTELRKNTLLITFHSGGRLKIPLSKLTLKDCDRLIGAIDEMADRCNIDDDVAALRAAVQPLLKEQEGAGREEFRALPNDEFKSTIFVPLAPGAKIAISKQEIRIVRLLSTKPLSAVYLGRLAGGQLVVVKQFFLAGEGAESETLRKVFLREHQLLAELEHPHIAKVLHVFEQEESSFIVLQHWQGADLRKIVEERGPLPVNRVIEYATQVCKLMHYLHARQCPVMHRDLSPDNLIVDDAGNVKLIDFGAAKQFIACVTGTLIGKQCYMAPEQIRGDTSPRSDIYGFGCVLYYILTGNEPKALSPSVPSTDVKVPRWLDLLVSSCTAFDEKDRPVSFFQLTEFFEKVAHTDPARLEKLVRDLVPPPPNESGLSKALSQSFLQSLQQALPPESVETKTSILSGPESVPEPQPRPPINVIKLKGRRKRKKEAVR